jgi:hypothetical protein
MSTKSKKKSCKYGKLKRKVRSKRTGKVRKCKKSSLKQRCKKKVCSRGRLKTPKKGRCCKKRGKKRKSKRKKMTKKRRKKKKKITQALKSIKTHYLELSKKASKAKSKAKVNKDEFDEFKEKADKRIKIADYWKGLADKADDDMKMLQKYDSEDDEDDTIFGGVSSIVTVPIKLVSDTTESMVDSITSAFSVDEDSPAY